VFLARVETAWRERALTAEGKRLTRLHVHIAAKLAFWRSPNPKQRSIARASRCSTRTVQRALAVLSGLGLLAWQRCVLATVGWVAQVANRYFLGSTLRYKKQVLICSANVSPPGTTRSASPSPRPSPALPIDLLAARRRSMEARMRAARE
jgi:hypothetical protein